MSFKLIPNPTIKASVNLTVPGQSSQSQIEVEFCYRVPQILRDLAEQQRPKSFLARIKAFLQRVWMFITRKKKEDPTNLAVLSQVVVGWSGVTDESDAPLEFSADRLATLLNGYPNAANEILAAYYAARAEQPSKN